MFRMHKASIINPYVSENFNYTPVAIPIIIKSMADVSPLHKAYVNITSGEHSQYVKQYRVIHKSLRDFRT